MGRSYFCDYCLKGFPDNRTSRNRHLTGAQHKTKVREFYAECTEPLKLLESSQNEKVCIIRYNVIYILIYYFLPCTIISIFYDIQLSFNG